MKSKNITLLAMLIASPVYLMVTVTASAPMRPTTGKTQTIQPTTRRSNTPIQTVIPHQKNLQGRLQLIQDQTRNIFRKESNVRTKIDKDGNKITEHFQKNDTQKQNPISRKTTFADGTSEKVNSFGQSIKTLNKDKTLTTFEYDRDSGNLQQTIAKKPHLLLGKRTSVTTSEYDNNGNLQQTIKTKPNRLIGKTTKTKTFTYDDGNQQQKVKTESTGLIRNHKTKIIRLSNDINQAGLPEGAHVASAQKRENVASTTPKSNSSSHTKQPTTTSAADPRASTVAQTPPSKQTTSASQEQTVKKGKTTNTSDGDAVAAGSSALNSIIGTIGLVLQGLLGG